MEEQKKFVEEMEEKYDFSRGAIGIGMSFEMPMPCERELRNLIEIGMYCPKCRKNTLIIKFTDDSIAHTLRVFCCSPRCDFEKDTTCYDNW